MTMLRCSDPDVAPGAVLTELEIEFLDASSGPGRAAAPTLDVYMMRVARRGGYLARRSDAPPGATVTWPGFSRLADLVDGFAIRKARKHLWVTESLTGGIRWK